MYRTLFILTTSLASLVFLQCKTATTSIQDDVIKLEQPAFANSPAHFNTYVAGVPSGGQGIEFYLEIDTLPAEMVLEKVYFRESVGKLMQGNGNYVARFRTDAGKDKDVIMSSNPEEEAVNTPPVQVEKFPFPLEKDEAGISYRENGILKYTKISNIKETESIAYPSVAPGDRGA